MLGLVFLFGLLFLATLLSHSGTTFKDTHFGPDQRLAGLLRWALLHAVL